MAKKGKYAGIVDKLPKYTGDDDPYQAKVEERKKKLLEEVPQTAGALAMGYAIARREKDKFNDLEYDLNLTIEAFVQLLDAQFENEGVTNLTLDTGENIRIQKEPHAKVVDKDACRAWAIANGLERELMLPWQTLNSLTKERLIAGEPEPDGVTSWSKTKVFFRSGD